MAPDSGRAGDRGREDYLNSEGAATSRFIPVMLIVSLLTSREAAVLHCFQAQPWVDPDNEKLDQCLAKIPDAIWRQKR